MGIEQWLTSFAASAGFGILFQAPRSSLVQCGLVGMFGWIVYRLCVGAGLHVIGSSMAGALVVAVLSQFCSKWFKTPFIVFSAAGIIPLVPGGLAYDAMRNVVENRYDVAVQLAAEAMMISGAIAMGLVFSEVARQTIRRVRE